MKKFVKITQVKVTGNRYEMNIGASPSGKATDSDSVIRVFESLRPSQQKTHFCLPTKVRFLNDVCLRQMMTASPNDVRYANDVCLTAHWANIASLRNEVKQHHICEANTSYRRKAMHHLKVYKAYALIYLRKCDIIKSRKAVN